MFWVTDGELFPVLEMDAKGLKLGVAPCTVPSIASHVGTWRLSWEEALKQHKKSPEDGLVGVVFVPGLPDPIVLASERGTLI